MVHSATWLGTLSSSKKLHPVSFLYCEYSGRCRPACLLGEARGEAASFYCRRRKKRNTRIARWWSQRPEEPDGRALALLPARHTHHEIVLELHAHPPHSRTGRCLGTEGAGHPRSARPELFRIQALHVTGPIKNKQHTGMRYTNTGDSIPGNRRPDQAMSLPFLRTACERGRCLQLP